jgi:GxxExxY protein
MAGPPTRTRSGRSVGRDVAQIGATPPRVNATSPFARRQLVEEEFTTEDTEKQVITGMTELTGQIVDAALTVHKILGPGLLESIYEACLAHELLQRGIPFPSKVQLPVNYKGEKLDAGYRIDLLLAETIVVELRSSTLSFPSTTRRESPVSNCRTSRSGL